MDLDIAALKDLIDKEAIREASLRYTRGIDRHDSALAVAAYHPDATDDHGAFIGDPESFVEYANRVHTKNWTCHHHYVTNQIIDLAGNAAHSETYFIAVLKRPDGICDLVGGRYVDRFEKRLGKWAVSDRLCLVEWNAEARPGEAPLDPDVFVKGTWDRTDPSYLRPLRADRPHRDLSSQN